MSEHVAGTRARSSELAAVITRCGCAEADKDRPDFHAYRGQVCPHPRAIETRVLAFWHRNPIVRLLHALKQRVRGQRSGVITFHKE